MMTEEQKQWQAFQKNDPEAIRINQYFSALHMAFQGLEPLCSPAAKELFAQLAEQIDRDCSRHLGNRIIELAKRHQN